MKETLPTIDRVVKLEKEVESVSRILHVVLEKLENLEKWAESLQK